MAAALAGDMQAADRVELSLPETGVCGVTFASEAEAGNKMRARATPSSAGSCGTSSCGVPARQEAVEEEASQFSVASEGQAAGGCCRAKHLVAVRATANCC